MDNLLSNLMEYWLSFSIIFLLLFTAISYIFVKEKVSEMYLGILRVLLSIFYSPIIFLKNSILNLASFGKKGEKEDIPSKQFLLKKVITFLETILIVISISFIVSGIIVGWNSFLPPLQLREARNITEDNLENVINEMEIVSPAYEQMQRFWETKKDSLINARIGQKKIELKNLQDVNKNLSQKLSNDNETNEIFNNIKNYLDNNYYSRYLSGYENIKNAVVNYIDGISYYINQNKINELKNYANNWYKVKLIEYELNRFSEEELRNEIQPNYLETERKYNQLKNQITNYESYLKYYNEQIKYDFFSLLKAIIIFILGALVYIWLIGLMIEFVNLSIDIANNVRVIRELKEYDKIEK